MHNLCISAGLYFGSISEGRDLRIILDEEMARANSRSVAHHLINFALRLNEMWRVACGGHQEAMVVMAIVAITGDRLSRSEIDPSLRNMANAVPRDLLGHCNLSSIAAASGLNRETARRVVNRLVEAGLLTRSAEGLVYFAPGRLQAEPAKALNTRQIEEFCRTADGLAREGILTASRFQDRPR